MFTIARPDGAVISGRLTRPGEGERPLARVLIVHGLGEHQRRYDGLARHLASQGLAVARYDHRGHGASTGAKGALPDVMALCADLGAVIDHLSGLPGFDQGPWLLLGHSMGGLVAARFVAEGVGVADGPGVASTPPAAWWRPVEGLVLSSPALDVGMNRLQRGLVGLLGERLPGLALGNGLKAEWISRDPAQVQAYRDDPLVHDRITPRLARFFLEAGQTVMARAPGWSVPTLLMFAGADRCVRPEGSERFAQRAPASVLVHQAFPALYHEIFNEPESAQVLAVLDNWLAAWRSRAPEHPGPSSPEPGAGPASP